MSRESKDTLKDSRLRAMVNLGLVRFDVLASNKQLASLPLVETSSVAFPSLFTRFEEFSPIKVYAAVKRFGVCTPTFLAESNWQRLVDTSLPEFLLAGKTECRLKAIILPSAALEPEFSAKAKELGFKVFQAKQAGADAQPPIDKFALNSQLNRCIIGTRGIVNLIPHLINCDTLAVVASSSAYFADASSSSAILAAYAGLKQGGALFLHAFPGAGLRISGKPPELNTPGTEVVKISKWQPGNPSSASQLPNLIFEILKTAKTVLVVYNRLGKSSGFQCVNCFESASCPLCDGILHYSRGNYQCSSCGFKSGNLVCHNCGSDELAPQTEGADAIAKAVSAKLGSGKAVLVGAVEPDITAIDGAKVVITTDVCLFRRLPFEAEAILISGIEDKLYRGELDGPENAAAYIAQIRGMYECQGAKTFVAAATEHEFFNWLTGSNKQYFTKRYDLARKFELPPFSPRYVLRVRADTDDAAANYFANIRREFKTLELGDPKKLRSESKIQKVYEAIVYTGINYALKKQLVETGRKHKVTTLPYPIYF